MTQQKLLAISSSGHRKIGKGYFRIPNIIDDNLKDNISKLFISKLSTIFIIPELACAFLAEYPK